MVKKKKKTKTKTKPVSHTKHKSVSASVTKRKITKDDWVLVSVFIGAILIISIMAGVANLVASMPTEPTSNGVALPPASGLTAAEAAENTRAFVVDYMGLPENVNVEVTSVTEESGVYKVGLMLSSGTDSLEADSYMSKDGKLFFVSGVNVEETKATTPAQPEVASVFDAPNESTPTVKFFVMSFCPYGTQAEQGLEPVYQLLGDSVNWEPHYVIYENYAGGGPDYCIDDGNLCSMHGIDELTENVRQLCVYKNYDIGTFWSYIKYVYTNCELGNINNCWKEAADYASVDTDMITTCAADNAVEYMAAEREANLAHSVSGSPTIFVNDQLYSGGRAPENLKLATCSGFADAPAECEEVIGAEAIAASGSC